MTHITIKYFASVRQTLGLGSQELETSARTVAELRDELIASGAVFAQALARGQALRVAMNHVMVDESAELVEGCELAFFPPVTGG